MSGWTPKFSDTDIGPKGGRTTRKNEQRSALYHSERTNSPLDGQYCSQMREEWTFGRKTRQVGGNRIGI